MERIVIKNVELEGVTYEKLHVYLDDEGSVIVLPLLWTVQLACKSTVHNWRTEGVFDEWSPHGHQKPSKLVKTFKEVPVAENTVENYVGHFFHFLKHINDLHKTKNTPSVHHTELVNSKFINNYLNKVLPLRLESSESLKAHQVAISAYYKFLLSINIKAPLELTIAPETIRFMAEKDSRAQKINYVSRSERRLLLNLCSNNRDKLILRMGYEVGLRTEENTGLVLGRHRAKNQNHKGLLDLFDDFERLPKKESFEFILNGKYTKRGKTRKIFFDRDLLVAMKNYYENERAVVTKELGNTCETLFVRYDFEGKGLPISADHASNIFCDLKKKIQHINQELSYHDLRHTFATELYHSLVYDEFGNERGSQNSALTEVKERLGHSRTDTTGLYIRMSIQMRIIEEGRLDD
jgi:integrase